MIISKKYIVENSIVRGTITKNKNIGDIEDDLQLIKKINFSNIDAFEMIDYFKGDKNTFIFLVGNRCSKCLISLVLDPTRCIK